MLPALENLAISIFLLLVCLAVSTLLLLFCIVVPAFLFRLYLAVPTFLPLSSFLISAISYPTFLLIYLQIYLAILM